MGVYIKGMEMPKNCLSCPLQGGTADCRLTQKTYNWGLTERPSDCPLIPIPEHGRLIDADAFLALINDSTILSDFLKCIINPLIRGEPTVIEAEEGE